MIKLQKAQTESLLAIHGWSGIMLGLLLYAVICTGTVAVFADEIGDWSGPLSHPAEHSLPPGLNPLIQSLWRETDPAYRDEIDLHASHGGRLFLRFEGHRQAGEPLSAADRRRHYGVEYQIDRNNLAILQRSEGRRQQLDAARSASALADFFVDLHVRLHLPNPWGIFLTGVLGLAMMIASVTGLIVHRHLLRELFTIRRGKSLLAARDTHVVAASWNLPFAFLLAFTGSFFSFASAVGLPAMAMVVFAGDQERAIEQVFGAPPASDDTPAPLADLDQIISHATQQAGAAPNFLTVRNPGRADAFVRVFVPAAGQQLTGRAFDYSGVDASFRRENPVLVGTVPSAGNSVAALMEPLHFGNFAGALSKALWFALGFAAAYVTYSGMRLWTTRRAAISGWRRMELAVHWVGRGLPLALVLVAHGYFLAPALDLPVQIAQWIVFWASALTALLLTTLLPDPRSASLLRRLLAAALLALPLLRWLAGGPGWLSALQAQMHNIIIVDLLLLAAGAACWASLRRSHAAQPEADGQERLPEPDR